MSDTAARTRALAVADQHPGEVGIVGETVNEYGTPVSVLRCATCGEVVTICPVRTTEQWGEGCLADTCASYDIGRDVDMFWDALSDNGLIGREDT